MRGAIAAVDVVDIVATDYLEVEIGRNLQEGRNDSKLFLDPVIHDFDKIVFAAEHFDKLADSFSRLGFFAFKEKLGDDSLKTAGESDQSIGMGGEEFEIGPRLVVKSVDIRVGDDLHQVLITFEVLCKEAHVVIFSAADLFFFPGRHEVNFGADQRFDVVFLGGSVKIDRTEEISVVGKCDRLHSEMAGLGKQTVDPAGSVEEAVIGVNVEMNEFLVG